MGRYRVTVDTGGTFSDFVYLNEDTGEVTISKVPSTPDDPSRAILAGIELLLAKSVRPADISYFCHGTKVGTNALLEGYTAMATVRREFYTNGELVVSFSSSDPSQLTVPLSVTSFSPA